MQLIAHFEAENFDGWKTAFDDDSENRMQAGLTLLQMWREADSPGHPVCLFDVNDRARAQGWLDRKAGFGQAVRAVFLKVA